jgi:hypothetical protein
MRSSLVLASRPCKPPSSSVARPTSRHASVVRRGETLLPPSPCSSFFPCRGPAMAPRRGSRLCARPSPPGALPWRAARHGAACPWLPGVALALRVARPPRPGVAWCARALLTARRGAAPCAAPARPTMVRRGAWPSAARPLRTRSRLPGAVRPLRGLELPVRGTSARPARGQHGVTPAQRGRGTTPCPWLGPNAWPAHPTRRVVPRRACDMPVYP